jgi:hypothetical protein
VSGGDAEPTPAPAEDDDLEPLLTLLREFAEWDARPVRLGYLEPL